MGDLISFHRGGITRASGLRPNEIPVLLEPRSHDRALRRSDALPDHRIAKVRRARWSFLIWALIAGALDWYIVALICVLALFFTRRLVHYAYPV